MNFNEITKVPEETESSRPLTDYEKALISEFSSFFRCEGEPSYVIDMIEAPTSTNPVRRKLKEWMQTDLMLVKKLHKAGKLVTNVQIPADHN
jgi:hypothetical protein